jgi:putative transposase
MSKPPRDFTSFGSNTYFVTTSTWGHRFLFQSERMADLFLDSLFSYRREGRFLVHEFVVMPNHVHLLLTPGGITLERAMQFVKGGFSFRVRKELHSNMEVWERGYVDHRIRDFNDYQQHAQYIHQNLVRGRLVQRADEFAYSSAHGGFELDRCPQGLKPLSSISA